MLIPITIGGFQGTVWVQVNQNTFDIFLVLSSPNQLGMSLDGSASLTCHFDFMLNKLQHEPLLLTESH